MSKLFDHFPTLLMAEKAAQPLIDIAKTGTHEVDSVSYTGGDLIDAVVPNVSGRLVVVVINRTRFDLYDNPKAVSRNRAYKSITLPERMTFETRDQKVENVGVDQKGIVPRATYCLGGELVGVGTFFINTKLSSAFASDSFGTMGFTSPDLDQGLFIAWHTRVHAGFASRVAVTATPKSYESVEAFQAKYCNFALPPTPTKQMAFSDSSTGPEIKVQAMLRADNLFFEKAVGQQTLYVLVDETPT